MQLVEVKKEQEENRPRTKSAEFDQFAEFVASQERDKYKRECGILHEKVLRLEEDCRVLRARELRGGERIKGLLEELERKDKEFDKFIKLREEMREFELSKKSLEDEVSSWKNRYVELLEAQLLRMEKEGKDIVAADSAHQDPIFLTYDNYQQPMKRRRNDQKSANGTNGRRETADIAPSSHFRSNRAYTGRFPSSEEQRLVVKRAEELQSKLKSSHRAFIKQMVLSHVSGGFSLSLPTKFCSEYLPYHDKVTVELEDEKGLHYDAIFLGSRSSLSGGWRRFAIDHNLEIGDALVFELTEPKRLKIYINKASGDTGGKIENEGIQDPTKEAKTTAGRTEDYDMSLSVKQIQSRINKASQNCITN